MKKIQKSAVRFDNLKQDFLDDKKYSGTAEATLNGYRYQKPEAFAALSETDKGTLMREVAPLISLDDKDEAAKRFDNFVYGLVLCELVKFLVDGVEGQKPIYTALADPVLEQTEGKALDSGYDFGEYRERVNRYIMEHRNDTLAIHKLTQNIPLSQGDYIELEHIFTSELGSKEDYAREFKDTPFGLLVCKVAKLDHEAAMQAFSKFINDESLNAKQIAFVQKEGHSLHRAERLCGKQSGSDETTL